MSRSNVTVPISHTGRDRCAEVDDHQVLGPVFSLEARSTASAASWRGGLLGRPSSLDGFGLDQPVGGRSEEPFWGALKNGSARLNWRQRRVRRRVHGAEQVEGEVVVVELVHVAIVVRQIS